MVDSVGTGGAPIASATGAAIGSATFDDGAFSPPGNARTTGPDGATGAGALTGIDDGAISTRSGVGFVGGSIGHVVGRTSNVEGDVGATFGAFDGSERVAVEGWLLTAAALAGDCVTGTKVEAAEAGGGADGVIRVVVVGATVVEEVAVGVDVGVGEVVGVAVARGGANGATVVLRISMREPGDAAAGAASAPPMRNVELGLRAAAGGASYRAACVDPLAVVGMVVVVAALVPTFEPLGVVDFGNQVPVVTVAVVGKFAPSLFVAGPIFEGPIVGCPSVAWPAALGVVAMGRAIAGCALVGCALGCAAGCR